MNDKKYYERQEQEKQIRQNAVEKARARVMAANEWFSKNKLSAETLPEFQALMNLVNRLFDLRA